MLCYETEVANTVQVDLKKHGLFNGRLSICVDIVFLVLWCMQTACIQISSNAKLYSVSC